MSQNFNNDVISCNVSHSGDYLSDHRPVTITLDINTEYNIFADKRFLPRTLWRNSDKEHINMYTVTLESLLRNISVPLSAIACVTNLGI